VKNLSLWIGIVALLGSVTGIDAKSKMALAELHDARGQLVGIATFTECHDGVRIALNLNNMPQGVHALHVHAAGSCATPDFKSAMGHFNPFQKKHGLKNPGGPHAGDLPNIIVGHDGSCAVVVTAPLATLGSEDNSLFREGGTALMIHEGPDDYATDPAGAAGRRIACGVITLWKGRAESK
jgi:Cu-Zn family superoxide dismutase